MTNNSNPLNGYRFDTREKGIETRGEQFAKLVKGSSASNKEADAKQDKEIKKVANDLASFKKNVYTKSQADSKFLTEHQDLSEYAKKAQLNAYAKKADVYTKAEVDEKIPPEQDLSLYAKKADVYTKTEVDGLIPDVSDFAAAADVEAIDARVTALENVTGDSSNVIVNFTETGRDETNPNSIMISGTTDLSRSEIEELIAAGKAVYLNVNDSDGNVVKYMSPAGGDTSVTGPGETADNFLFNFMQDGNNVVFYANKIASQRNLEETNERVTALENAEQYHNVFVNFTETGRDETNPNFMMVSGTTDLSESEIAEFISQGLSVYINVNDSDGNVAKYMSPAGGNISLTGPGETAENLLFNFMQDGNNVVFYANKIASQRNLEATNERVTALENGQYHNVFVNFTETGRETLDNGVVKISGTTDFSETEIAEFISQGLSVYLNTNDSDGNVAKYMSAQGGQVSMLEVNDDPEAFLFSFEQNGNDVVFYARSLVKAGDFYTKAEVDALLRAHQAQYMALMNIVGQLGGDVVYEYPNDYITGASALNTLMTNYNGITKVVANSEFPNVAGSAMSKNTMKLNMNGKTLTQTRSGFPAIMARGTQTYTIYGSGTIEAGNDVCIQANGTGVTINLTGNTTNYHNNNSGAELIYCYQGLINICGGVFRNDGEDKSFMINCYDANYRNGTANIVIYSNSTSNGPKFYDFNPADCSSEGEHTNFVRSDCEVRTSTVTEGDVEHTVYMVVKSA